MAHDAQGAGSRDAGVGSFGLQVLLVALAVLFAATVIVTWWFRDEAPQWEQAVRPLPLGLILATAALAGLSALVELAARRAAQPARAARLTSVAAVCLLLFLFAQFSNWSAMIGGRPPGERTSFYEFNFVLLTVLHALHVVGGIIFHVLAWLRARAAAPSAAATLRNNATYWHFLAGVWAVILANVWLARIPAPAESWLGPASVALLGLAGLAVVGDQALVIREFARRGRPGMAAASLMPPFALLAFWAHAGDWGQERRLARWSLSWLIFLCLLMLAAAIHADALFGG